MKVQTKSLNFLRSETKIEIPFFQRPYVWKYENAKLLLQDLFRTNGNHFLGSILLKLEDNDSEDENVTPSKQVVIDGQQRLTTLSILVKVMFDFLMENRALSNPEIVDGQRALFYLEDRGYVTHLENSYHDKDNFKKIIGDVKSIEIQGHPFEEYTKPEYESVKKELDEDVNLTEDEYEKKYNESENLLRECYKYFIKEIYSKNVDIVKQLWTKLFSESVNLLVIIRLDATDKEQEIFDTINSAGMHLSSTDIIKNHLYQKLMSTGVSQKKVLEKYKKSWEQTFENESNYSFWNKEKNVGRNLRSNIELFFQAYGIIHEPKIYDVEEDTIADLAKKFKEYLTTLHTTDEVEKFIDDIMNTASIYQSLPHFSSTDAIKFDEIGKRVACTMDISDNTTFTPYLLYLYKKYDTEDTQEELKSKLAFVDNVLMHYIVSGNSNKNFNKYCTDLIDYDKNGSSNSSSLNEITFEDLQKGIKIRKNNTLAKLILYFIELHRNFKLEGSDKKYIALQFTNEMELEHILPKKWEENWGPDKTPYVYDDGTLIEDQNEGKKNRESRLLSLGNMTILSKKLNIKISNENFYNKIKGKDTGKKKIKHIEGVRELSSFSITTEFLPDENARIDEYIWNEQTISTRENNLLNEIIEIWPLQ